MRLRVQLSSFRKRLGLKILSLGVLCSVVGALGLKGLGVTVLRVWGLRV